MAFHVFVEGATDATPAGVARLAQAIAKHYGLAAADLHARLQKGRFRVKGNIDRATAEQFCRDLQILGARCVIEEANADNSQRSTPLPFPAVRPATPVAGVPEVSRAPTLPASTVDVGRAPTLAATGVDVARAPTLAATSVAGTPNIPRTSTPPARPTTPPAGSQQYQSGLSAAFSGETPGASLGALENEGVTFSLSSVDGADEQRPSDAAFAPPPESMSASIGPAQDKPKIVAKPAGAKPGAAKPATPAKPAAAKPKPELPKDEPLDMFAPPDAQGDEFKVDIAADELEHSAKKRASTPPPVEIEPPRSTSQKLARSQSEPTARKSQPSVEPASEGAAGSSKLGPLGNARVRFAAGVVLAIVIGFVPAHLIAGMREDSAFKEIDMKVMAAQQLADTPDAYATLDAMRADQLERKKGAQRNAAIMAFAVWALVAGGIAFAWFKKVPWERYE
ncbi:MAG TPA: hypothetical protein VIV11_34325 [Kofleriaceae bacterium]